MNIKNLKITDLLSGVIAVTCPEGFILETCPETGDVIVEFASGAFMGLQCTEEEFNQAQKHCIARSVCKECSTGYNPQKSDGILPQLCPICLVDGAD